MDSLNLYKEIYCNQFSFESYVAAQKYTEKGKKIIASSIMASLGINLTDKTICVLPSDIGVFIRCFVRFAPSSKYILVDKSPKALEYIRNNIKLTDVTYYCLDIQNLAHLRKKIDIAICIFGIHLLTDIKLFIGEISKKLVHSGKLALVTMSPEQERHHPMSKFFSSTISKNRFISIDKINQISRGYGLLSRTPIEICYNQTLKPDDIPIVFSRYANSFLFMQNTAMINKFHSYLRSMLDNDKLHLVYYWTLIIFDKR